jgi:D-amino-acid dehydrogenase
MRVIVVGAGVIGVTTAWFLRAAGHDVEVIERSDGPGDMTSFANAGQLSYGYAMPWAAPGVPLKAAKWMFSKNAPFKLHVDTDDPLRQLRWLTRMFSQCNREDFQRNKTRMLAISTYSREVMGTLRQAVPLDFDHQAKGTLQLFRTDKQLAAGAVDAELLHQSGVRAELITDMARLVALEPALGRAKTSFTGGVFLPDDETGDCHKFTRLLAAFAASAGVVFHYGEELADLRKKVGPTGQLVQTVRKSADPGLEAEECIYECDAVVLCAGVWSATVLSLLGLDYFSTLYPVKGYSLTYDVTNAEAAPTSTVMDETYKVAITRLGGRVRVGGTAELSGFNHILREGRRQTLAQSVTDLFPEAGNVATAKFWTGLRPSTPTGVPVVGRVPGKSVWVNFGHGTLGWTMAAGCAKALAAQLTGGTGDVPAEVRSALEAGMSVSDRKAKH